MNTAYIISYYNNTSGEIERVGTPSSAAIIDYLSEIVNDLHYEVNILSPSWYNGGDIKKMLIKDDRTIKRNVRLINAPTIARKGSICNILNKALSRIWLLWQLCIKIKYDVPVFLYHHPSLIFPVKVAKIVKKAKIIVITEELYSDVMKSYLKSKTKETRYLNSIPAAYIFPTKMLDDKVNINNRPNVIIHGTYHVENDVRELKKDNKIHVVYAGTFNQTKGGAFAAVSAAEFLPSNYHVHIIGFGSVEEEKKLLNAIEKVKEHSLCSISYDGLKLGDEYIKYIQNCEIGLSVQNPNAAYNATSFPSKVLSYLSNGLHVVSIRIDVLESSAVADLLVFYEEQEPKAIASAIMNVNIELPYNSRKRILNLNEEAHQDMKRLLGELGYENET